MFNMSSNTALQRPQHNAQDTQYQIDYTDLLYRLQLGFIYVYPIRGSLIIRGTDRLEDLRQIKQHEAGIIKYITEEARSPYWILYTVDNGFLPLRFKSPVDLKAVQSINYKVISAMPAQYEAGLFDIEAGEVFG